VLPDGDLSIDDNGLPALVLVDGDPVVVSFETTSRNLQVTRGTQTDLLVLAPSGDECYPRGPLAAGMHRVDGHDVLAITANCNGRPLVGTWRPDLAAGSRGTVVFANRTPASTTPLVSQPFGDRELLVAGELGLIGGLQLSWDLGGTTHAREIVARPLNGFGSFATVSRAGHPVLAATVSPGLDPDRAVAPTLLVARLHP
jgi:hypothetical protein